MEHVSETKQLIEKDAKDAPVKDILWNANQIDTASETHLEDDEGTGAAALIRMFEFGVNPIAFKEHKPTKQEIFNSHLKGIESLLWADGLKIMTDVEPKLTMGKKKYRIFVGAQPQKGHILKERPQTLSQISRNEKGV